jgi:hypothetical protein
MPLQAYDQAKLEELFLDIAPFAAAYRNTTLRVFAVRAKSQFEVYLGLLELSAFSEGPALREFETDDVYCAEGNLEGSGLTPRGIVKSLLSASIDIGNRSFGFPADHGGHHSAHSWLFDGSAIDVRLTLGQLTLSGANDRYIYVQQPTLIRQLNASTKYYDGLRELCADFGLGYENGMNPHFDICATRVAEILDSSSLDGSRIAINIRLAGALSTSELALGLVIASKDGTLSRLHLSADDIAM